MPYGHITRLVFAHHFGFLVDDAGMDWFFVEGGVRSGRLDALRVEDRVAFSSEWTAGGPRAADVHLAWGERAAQSRGAQTPEERLPGGLTPR